MRPKITPRPNNGSPGVMVGRAPGPWAWLPEAASNAVDAGVHISKDVLPTVLIEHFLSRWDLQGRNGGGAMPRC